MDMTPEEKRLYHARHRRNEAVRGKASLFKCVDCAERGVDKQARDWSWRHGTDPDDPMNYDPRCRKCHIAYDPTAGHHKPHSEETKALLSQKNRGYKHTPEAVEKIRAAARNPSPEARAKMAAAGRKSGATRRAAGPMPAEQRAKLSAASKGNTNAAGKGTGKRSGQALENIRAGQQRRREREQAEREARESGAA